MEVKTVIKAVWLLASCSLVAAVVAAGTNAAEKRAKLEKQLEEEYGVDKVLLYPGQDIAHVVIGNNYELYRTAKIGGEIRFLRFPDSKAPVLQKKVHLINK